MDTEIYKVTDKLRNVVDYLQYVQSGKNEKQEKLIFFINSAQFTGMHEFRIISE